MQQAAGFGALSVVLGLALNAMAQPPGARPAGQQIDVLAALEPGCSLLERAQAQESDRRRDSARALDPLKEDLSLSEESLAQLEEINRLLAEVRGAP